MTYSGMPKGTLPSAQSVFTSEFEMGSGGTHSLMPPGETGRFFLTRRLSRSINVMDHSIFSHQSTFEPSDPKAKLLEVIWSSLTGN